MNRRLRSFTIAIVIIAGFLAAGWCAGPYLAMRGIRGALERGDMQALARHVDFTALQASLSSQVKDRIRAQVASRMGSGSLATGTSGMVETMADHAVRAMASPAGIGILLKGDSLLKRVTGNTTHDGSLVPKTTPADPLATAHARFESPTRFTATVDAQGGPVVFVFQPRHLRWQLTDIRLPPPR